MSLCPYAFSGFGFGGLFYSLIRNPLEWNPHMSGRNANLLDIVLGYLQVNYFPLLLASSVGFFNKSVLDKQTKPIFF